jgi:hypothetical protein
VSTPASSGQPLVVRTRRYRKGRAGVVLSIRLDAEEFDAVGAAAEQAGTYVSDYARGVLVRAALAAGQARPHDTKES